MADTACARARITKKGVDYTNHVLHERLSTDFKAMTISDTSGESSGAKWEISSINNEEARIERSSMAISSTQNSFSWSLDGIYLSLHGRWHAKYRKGIIKVSDGGKVRVRVKDVGLHASINLGADANGRPTVTMADCAVNVHDVDVKFEGGTAFLYNLFRDYCGRRLRDLLRDKLHSTIQKFINTDGEKMMSKLNVSTHIGKYFNLDYGLTHAPVITDHFIETSHKGKVSWKADGSEASLPAAALPARGDNLDKMLYFELSEHVANCMGSLAHANDVIQFTYKAGEIPEKLKSALLVYLSFLSSGQVTQETIPQNQLQVSLKSTSAPVVTISNGIMDVSFKSNVTLTLDKGEEEPLLLCILNVDVCLSLEAMVAEEQIRGKLVNQRFHADIVEAPFNVSPVLDDFLQGLLSLAVAYTVNDVLEKGIALPVSNDMKFTDTAIQLNDGACIISTNVRVD